MGLQGLRQCPLVLMAFGRDCMNSERPLDPETETAQHLAVQVRPLHVGRPVRPSHPRERPQKQHLTRGAPRRDLGGGAAGAPLGGWKEGRGSMNQVGGPISLGHLPTYPRCVPQVGSTHEIPRPSSWRVTGHKQPRAQASLPSSPHHKCGPPRRPGD